jgi:hypothetical protein
MSAGDENRADAPQPVALLDDARKRKRGSAKSSRDSPGSSGASGQRDFDERRSAYSNAEFLDALGETATADEILDRLDSRPPPHEAAASPASRPQHTASNGHSAPDAASTQHDADDAIRAAIERHHQRPLSTQAAWPRGSADLSPAHSTRERHIRRGLPVAHARPHGRTRTLAIASACALLITVGAGIAALGVTRGGSTGGRPGHRTTMAPIGQPASSANLASDIYVAGREKAVHAEAAERAQSSRRARSGRTAKHHGTAKPTRKHRASAATRGWSPAHTPPSSSEQSLPVSTPVSAQRSYTEAATTAPATRSSTSSATGSLPAGPTSQGSAGSSCNPKCP